MVPLKFTTKVIMITERSTLMQHVYRYTLNTITSNLRALDTKGL